jgi:hypothetical protein
MSENRFPTFPFDLFSMLDSIHRGISGADCRQENDSALLGSGIPGAVWELTKNQRLNRKD